MIEGLSLIIPKRLALLRSALILSMMVSMLLSLPLWSGDRDFPLVPVWPGFVLGLPLNWIILIATLLCFLFALVSHFQRIFLTLAMLLSILLVCADINRLQHWYYLYTSMLGILLFYNGRVDNPNTFQAFFVVLQLMLASVYFFNGLSQLNPYFVENSFTPLIRPIQGWMSERQFGFFVRLGFLSPWCLMLTGLGLLIRSVRFLAISLALITHVLLAVFLLPGIDGNNYPLWASNLEFPVFLLLLFSGNVGSKYFSPAFLLQKLIFYPVFVLYLTLPFFNRLGFWPDYFSSNYRSGNGLVVKIRLSESAFAKLPETLQTYCKRDNFVYNFDYRTWSENELYAECFPNPGVFQAVYQSLLQASGNDPDEVSMEKTNRYKLRFRQE
ncbi:MAG TPA: hypothetical protein PLQ93_06720 [Bacteroidia bacterium]|nr:hypothetical protein [Bacteroidia bacterium]